MSRTNRRLKIGETPVSNEKKKKKSTTAVLSKLRLNGRNMLRARLRQSVINVQGCLA